MGTGMRGQTIKKFNTGFEFEKKSVNWSRTARLSKECSLGQNKRLSAVVISY